MGFKYKVNSRFFHSWSPAMAYVLGFLFSDGSMEDAYYIRGRYVRVSSTDRDRVVLIKKLLESEHPIVTLKKSPKHKPQYLLRIGDKELYSRLTELGMTPKKSLTMKFPAIPKKVIAYFILGYFDGDGCVTFEKGVRSNPTRLRTIFTSGSRNFLTSLYDYLKDFVHTTGGGIYQHASTKSTYQLRLTARDSIRLYYFMYSDKRAVSLALKRKRNIFCTYLKELGIRKDNVKIILDKKGPVAN